MNFDVILPGSKKRCDSDRHYLTNIIENLIFIWSFPSGTQTLFLFVLYLLCVLQQDFIISFISVLHVSCSFISKYFIIPIMNFYITITLLLLITLILLIIANIEKIHVSKSTWHYSIPTHPLSSVASQRAQLTSPRPAGSFPCLFFGWLLFHPLGHFTSMFPP